jgi:hypothetical protein
MGITTTGERFLAFARNDKQNSGPVISNEVRDLSELQPPLVGSLKPNTRAKPFPLIAARRRRARLLKDYFVFAPAVISRRPAGE